ncbi:phage holin [Bacillus spongiae]|uniref:Phage holin n=1 Tax=Bacillus spongiae TaxID=2683610 RepID=A0ABU8H8N2_9BACI
MNRFKNYALWAAVLAFVPLLADSLQVYDISVILPGNYDNLVISFLGILVLAGVINNPTSGKGLKDDE